jgi:hypothetical protein
VPGYPPAAVAPGSASAPPDPDGVRARTGPRSDDSWSCVAWVTSVRVTGAPLTKLSARPVLTNSQPSGPQVSWACWRETVGSLTMISLSGLRPMRTVSPGPKL